MRSAFFQAETKMVIVEMVLRSSRSSDKIIPAPVVIDDKSGIIPMEVEFYPGPEIDLTTTLHHISALQSTESIAVKRYVDLFGNGKVMLPQRNKPFSCKAQVVFG